jgi:hypothetical protein
MARPMIVGLHGPAGSGKTYCGTMFIEQGFRRVKFADPLKRMVRTLLEEAGVPSYSTDRYIEGELKDVHFPALGASPRYIMQTFGEAGRSIAPNFWVDLALGQVNEYVTAGRSVVIDDCRYPNEAQAILDAGGEVVEIIGRRHTVAVPEHISEEPLDARYITDALNNTGDWALAWGEVSRIIAKGNKP